MVISATYISHILIEFFLNNILFIIRNIFCAGIVPIRIKKRVTCHFCKYVYIAKEAQEKYEIKLVSSRKHIRYSDEEIKIINNIVSPLIRSGYSPEVRSFLLQIPDSPSKCPVRHIL